MNQNLSKYIDHTLLSPTATKSQIEKLCKEADEFQFASVCVNPSYVSYASELLKNSAVKVCTVIGFPLGATSTEAKVFETKQAIEEGATEIDMVINQGQAKDKGWEDITSEIKAIKETCGNLVLKVILETSHLTDEEIMLASKAASDAGADFVKTSTGFGSGGASIHAVKLMKKSIAANVAIKASGGIRDKATAEEYIALGVTRIGTSSGISIINNETSTSNY